MHAGASNDLDKIDDLLVCRLLELTYIQVLFPVLDLSSRERQSFQKLAAFVGLFLGFKIATFVTEIFSLLVYRVLY
jgi:hypothetical protein